MDTELALPGFDKKQLSLLRLFHPYAFKKAQLALSRNMRFVHYTSADVAMRIFQTQQVWMRNATCMNDFMEIEHGFECLNAAYKNQREKFQKTFDSLFPDFSKKLQDSFNDWLPHFRSDTYLACVSEHDDKEDELGRLSMWRAYGGDAGVAIVMKGLPFLTHSDALKAHTNPVAYLSKEEYSLEFSKFLDGIQANAKIVKDLGEERALAHVFEAFRYATMCTKHVGFHEEREWRIIYSPAYEKSDRIVSGIESIRGTPQPVCKIPLKDVPAEALIGIEIPKLVDRVIVGPTRHPLVIREAFVALLNDAGVTEAQSRVFVSDIPLRQ